MNRPSTIERAFELARSGEFEATRQITDRLRAEGYWDATAQLDGPALRAQLKKLCKEARRDAAQGKGRPAELHPPG
jgi:hypothetical protein